MFTDIGEELGDEWFYRYYADTGVFAAVNVTGNGQFLKGGVYVLGGPFGNDVVFIDTLANLLQQIP